MRIKLFRNYGNDQYEVYMMSFRDKTGDHREFVRAHGGWNRNSASEALDTLEKLYGIKRKNIRFYHVN